MTNYRNITKKSAFVPFHYPERLKSDKWNSKRAIPRRKKKVKKVSTALRSRLVRTLLKRSSKQLIVKSGHNSKMRSFILKPKI